MRITEGYQNMFRIPELKRRLLFTAFILIIYRLGSHVPTPGVDTTALKSFFEGQQGTLLSLYDLFAGGNFSKATIFALGIMPYISASIILQLMQAVVPALEKLAKEGEEGRAKITQYTRYGTVLLATIQAAGISIALENFTGAGGQPVVPDPGLLFKFVTVVTLVAGTIFVMWLGEQITERGIGNGISLIITIGIIASYPTQTIQTIQQMRIGELTWIELIPLLAFMVVVIALIILITQGQNNLSLRQKKAHIQS